MKCCTSLDCPTRKTLEVFDTSCFCDHPNCEPLQKTLEFFKTAINKTHSIVCDFAEYYNIHSDTSDFNQLLRFVTTHDSVPHNSKSALLIIIQLRNLVEHFSNIKKHMVTMNMNDPARA